MALIDEEPDYLSIAPDLTFRSRTRFQDEDTGEWISETEVIESAAELVELYNPSDVFAAFAEAAREAAGSGRADRRGGPVEVAGIASRRPGRSARTRMPPRPTTGPPASRRTSRRRRRGGRPPAVRPRARLPGAQPAQRGAPDRAVRGRGRTADGPGRRPDHRRRRRRAARARGQRQLPRRGRARRTPTASGGRSTSAEEIVQFYDPTDLFGDLAEALAEAYPAVAPEDQLRGRRRGRRGGRGRGGAGEDVGRSRRGRGRRQDGAEGRPTA